MDLLKKMFAKTESSTFSPEPDEVWMAFINYAEFILFRYLDFCLLQLQRVQGLYLDHITRFYSVGRINHTN